MIMQEAVYLEEVSADEFVAGEADDFNERHDDQLEWTRLAQHSSVRDQYSGGREICWQHAGTNKGEIR